jgi:hypothetical protein
MIGMNRKFEGPADYLRAAKDPEVSAFDLAELARSEYCFVKLAVVQHDRVTSDILNACVPAKLKTSEDNLLALAIARNAKSSNVTLKAITDSIIERDFRGDFSEIALSLCLNASTSRIDIERIISSKNANSKFRVLLNSRCSRNYVKYALNRIKQENKAITAKNQLKPELQTQEGSAKKSIESPSSSLNLLRDNELIGSWTFTDSSSSDHGYSSLVTISISIHETFIFLHDGRFLRMSDYFADHSSVALQMAWSRSEVGNRGRWSTRLAQLHLEWEDDCESLVSYAIFREMLKIRWSKEQRLYLRN